ncbi:hypothetical protein GCM10023310_72270 [Paenibacillus vulneris]|uniref:Phage tail spike protein n=1 Tax=Paenibacillus vulneris TaxID=1133364 RepID=A0ABW3UHT1_9BACL
MPRLSYLGEIDPYKKPIKPHIFLAKPNREIIAKISEAYNVKYREMILQLNDITFDVPYDLDFNHSIERNRNTDLFKERYLLKVVRGTRVEWFTITKIHDNMDEEKDFMSIEASSLGYQLRSRLLKSYHNDSAHAKTVLTEVLRGTNWTTDYIDADFQLTYREFDFPDTNVLDAVYQIAETYNAVIQWNTTSRTISMMKPELFGVNKGLKFSYGHYLKTLGKESNSDEMVTRLKAYGKDGLSIQNVNPTGQPFIENFSYFMFPFERDSNRNVINHSEYMSDSLCHALIDYSELIENKKDEFGNLLKQKESLQSTLSSKDNELKTLLKQEAAVDNIVTLQQADNNMWFYKYNHNASPVLNTTKLNPLNAYVLMIKVNSTDNLTVKVNGIVVNVVSGAWVTIGKSKFSSFESIETSGSSTGNEIYIQIANITELEYSTSNNEGVLIEKYCIDNKKIQIQAKKSEIAELNKQINAIETSISTLRQMMAAENNFTPEQLGELNDYIFEGTFSDEKYIDEHDLFKDAKEKFIELQKPQLVINISVVDFLRIIEEQHNWSKLVLGDTVTIEYEKIGVKVTARIIGIEFDYENFDINLTIANVKDITDNRKLFEKYIYNSNYTSVVVNGSKDRWGQAVKDSSEMSQLFENFWNKVTNEINMASNEYVTIDRKGITIIDPNDPLRFLRATHGTLGLTRSGGLRFETAISPDGIIAEMVLGKLILGERVTIGDPNGVWLTEGPRTTITDRCGREVMKLGLYDLNPDKFGMILNRFATPDCSDTTIINRVIVDRDEGFLIERKEGSGWNKTAWLDMDGYFNGRGIKIDYMSGILNNGILLDNLNGLVITRSDNQVRTRLNATEGFSIERFENNQWKKKFFADINGQFYSNDLIARRLRIVNDLDDLLLDSNTNYMNIGRFENIITDGKLTAVEKLTLKQEWETIQTEYQKLKYQAEQYEYSDRDHRTVSHINIPPFVNAFVALGNYVNPLLADMSATTPIDREEFKTKFQTYYDQAKRIINEITDALKFSSWQFGIPYNRVTMDVENGLLVERSDNKFRSIFNATYGILLQKNVNGSWINQFSVSSSDGVIEARGLRIFDTDIDMMKGKLTNGITIDPSNGIVVTRSDGVTKVGMDSLKGMYIQRNGRDVFWADTNGILHAVDLIAERLILNGQNGKLLIDANKNLIDFDAFDMKLGTLTAKDILSQMITSDVGFIANLTANRLKTIGINAEKDWSNYISIIGNEARWITGKVKDGTSGVQEIAPDGNPLFWKDAQRSGITTTNTGMPVMKFEYDEKVKMRQYFENTGIDATPVIEMGEGDSNTNPLSARGFIKKPNGSWDFTYYSSNYAKERSIVHRDDGLYLFSQEEKINIDCNDLNANVTGGVNINHASGLKLEVNPAGNIFKLTMPNGSYTEWSSSGKKEYIVGDIYSECTGKHTTKASEIHLDA